MNVSRIHPQQVMQRLQRGEPAMLLDVRTAAEFEAVHAEGARLIPLDELAPEQVIEQCKDNAGGSVYVLCHNGGRATKAAERLQRAGFEQVCVIEGGTQAWEAAGLPVQRGRQTMSLERQVRIAAGALVLLGVLLGWLVHPALYLLTAFVGGGLIFAGLTDTCGMAMLLAKLPWNRRAGRGSARTCSV